MQVQMKLKAQVCNTFMKDYDIKGQKVTGYNIGLMNEDGCFTMKCTKEVHEQFASQLVQPMAKVEALALYDPASQKNDVRIVALSVIHK